MRESNIWDYLYSRGFNKENIAKQGEWLEKYNQYVEPLKQEIILDLGCGEGGNALYYKNLGYRVVACDFSQVVLDRIKRRDPDMRDPAWPSVGSQDLDLRGIPGGLSATSDTVYEPDRAGQEFSQEEKREGDTDRGYIRQQP